jgi:hypothetical protein
MSTIEFEHNWFDFYVLYYKKKSNRLQTTVPNIFSLISADPADLFHIKKIIFSKKKS